jgi:hypothetical protein
LGNDTLEVSRTIQSVGAGTAGTEIGEAVIDRANDITGVYKFLFPEKKIPGNVPMIGSLKPYRAEL